MYRMCSFLFSKICIEQMAIGMCILATDAKPSSTRLFTLPVVVSGAPWTCLLYTNDLKTTSPALMIVPFPNPTSARRFGLVDVSRTRGFRQQLVDVFAPHEPARPMSKYLNATDGMRSQSYAAVLTVGNYKCSVVPSLAELNSSIDWSRFTVPADLASRLSVLGDTSVIPAHCGFVVAEALTSVVNDGFGIVYPGRDLWLPTCHETSSAPPSYDVCCYAFNGNVAWGSAAAPPPVVLPCSPYYVSDRQVGLDGIMRLLPRELQWSSDGSAGTMDPDAVSSVTFIGCRGVDVNKNIVGTFAAAG